MKERYERIIRQITMLEEQNFAKSIFCSEHNFELEAQKFREIEKQLKEVRFFVSSEMREMHENTPA